jgi:hypothetical protein
VSKAAKIVAAVVVTVAAVVTLNPQLIASAISMDAALVIDAVMPKPKLTSAGTESQWKADPRAGIPYLVGRCAVAGDKVFERSAPAQTGKYKNPITVYTGAGPIDAWEGFYANDVFVPFTADGGEGASGYYLNRMWLRYQLGGVHENYLHWTATGSKDTPANHGGMPTEWTPAHRMSGYAASLWGLEYDTAKYSGGVPTPKVVGRWVKVYDPRKDSTYPGGVGPHRYADPSNKAAYLAAAATWEWSANPYLHGLMWCLGRWTGDPSYPDLPLVKTHGLGAPIGKVDVPSFVECANVAHANDWTLGGKVYSTDDKWEVLKLFLEAGGGEPILLGDKIACMVNAPKVSLATLTKADAIGDVSVAGTVAIEDRINTVWPSYTEETLNWSVVPFDQPVQVEAYLGPDKGPRSLEMALPMVQSPVQMAQLARYRIEDSRELTPIVIPAKPWTMWLRPGDCFTANEPEWGLNGQKLLILQRKRDPATMRMTFICRTETDGKHAFALGQTATPPDTPSLTGLDRTIVLAPAGDAWTIVAGEVAGESGSLPGIVISGQVDLYDAVSVIVDYRQVLPTLPVTYGEWKSASFPASSRTLVVQGLAPGGRYQVHLRYITASGVENPALYTDLGEIVVGGVDAGTVAGRPAADVVAAIDLNAEQIAAEILRGALWRAYSDALLYLAGVPVGTVLLEEREQRVSANEAFAALMDLLGAKNGAGTAFILNAESVQVTPTQSLATFLTFINSTLGDGSVSITELREALNGQEARVALSINANGHLTGYEITSTGGFGDFTIVSDKLQVVDPADTVGATAVTVLSYEAGRWVLSDEVYVRKLVVGSLYAEHFTLGAVETPALQDNSVSNRIRGAKSTVTAGTGFDVTEFTYTFDLPYDADVEVFGNANFLDGGGNGPSYHASAIKLLIDGVEVAVNSQPGANAMTQLTTFGGAAVSGGTGVTCTVSMTVMTKPDDDYDRQNFLVRWFFK